ncbi:MAG: DUF5397 family protein [Pseudomonadota bacterium]
MNKILQTPASFVGEFKTFGQDGVAYEVIEAINSSTVMIRVVETGETLVYAVQTCLTDPQA